MEDETKMFTPSNWKDNEWLLQKLNCTVFETDLVDPNKKVESVFIGLQPVLYVYYEDGTDSYEEIDRAIDIPLEEYKVLPLEERK